ncbi:MAG: hypothetical protein M1305_07600 [Candidatus Marsarchaeota archaeon]|nr:hypothetical protein [Candidatus Marsarchaeota archaeon]
MARLKRGVLELRKRAIDSLVLAIELFNRPYDNGRAEAVLIHLHHAFEMLLKAGILDRTGTVHVKGGKYTYSFGQCLEKALAELKLISADERTTLSILDALRDTATHYFQDVSEDILYVQAQASVTLFDELLSRFFGQRLADTIPSRVLPVSTRPPKDLQLLLDSELSQVDALLRTSNRKGIQAAAKLRPILAIAAASREESERITERGLHKALQRRRRGEEWAVVLPEIAQLKLVTHGDGIPIYMKITKDAEMAVRIAKEGDPVIGTVVKQEINIWDKFNMGRNDLAEKLGLTGPKTSALILELKIQDDPECFRKLRRNRSVFDGYSKKALDRLRGAIESGIDVQQIWMKHRHRFGASKKKMMTARLRDRRTV